MTRLWERLLYHGLCWLDRAWPGWSAPRQEPVEYLSHEAFAFWMTREGRR